jgi:hypothetical protein
MNFKKINHTLLVTRLSSVPRQKVRETPPWLDQIRKCVLNLWAKRAGTASLNDPHLPEAETSSVSERLCFSFHFE